MANAALRPARRILFAGAAVLAGAACEASQPARPAELSPAAAASLARLPDDQRATAEHLLRERPRMGPVLLVYVDGERVLEPDAPGSPYRVINPDRIAKAELLTGDAAERRVGPHARDGVLWITTKPAAGTSPPR